MKHKHIKKRYNVKKRPKTWVVILLIILFVGITCFSAYKIYCWHKDNQKIEDLGEKINQEIIVDNIDTEGELVNPPEEDKEEKTSDYWYYIGIPFYNVDFSSLVEKNKDTVAFIHVPNTNINYPVVQSSNNDYYLHHAYDRSYNEAGWVFMDYRNNAKSLNDNAIIYGHGRLDTTVFGSLKNVLTSKWQNNKDNYVIHVSTLKENMVFQIFSIYTVPEENYYITTDFSNKAEKEKWINEMNKRNQAPTNTTATADDYILTLSTCKNNKKRIVVQAKLIKRQAK